MPQIISRHHLNQLTNQLLAADKTVVGLIEANDRYFLQRVEAPQDMNFHSSVMPSNSIKEFFFPRSEAVCLYQHDGKELIVTDVESTVKEQVIFGVRPCDAASLPILDHVFAWDTQDRFYQQRRERTTVISFACQEADKNCFCTSVGLSPETSAGADAMLLPINADSVEADSLEADSFEVRTFTEKGKALFHGRTAESDKAGRTAEPPKIKFDAERVKKHLQTHFVDSTFEHTSMRCVGCGGCTYVCPTCHCFDIVDEGGAGRGRRVKNWDACQFSMFTLHASGHNPRPEQSARQRNRVQHKFNVYPEKFGAILCTGCGNCTRVCSASLGIHPVLELLSQQAAAE